MASGNIKRPFEVLFPMPRGVKSGYLSTPYNIVVFSTPVRLPSKIYETGFNILERRLHLPLRSDYVWFFIPKGMGFYRMNLFIAAALIDILLQLPSSIKITKFKIANIFLSFAVLSLTNAISKLMLNNFLLC